MRFEGTRADVSTTKSIIVLKVLKIVFKIFHGQLIILFGDLGVGVVCSQLWKPHGAKDVSFS